MTLPASPVSVADHSLQPPTLEEADGAPTWVTRGSRFVIAITAVRPGTRLHVAGNPDEHFVLLPDTAATLHTAEGERHVAGNSLVIVPPGDCTVVAAQAGHVVRCFTERQQALLARAANRADFEPERPGIRPLQDWPAPPDGWRVRVYPLDGALAEGDKTRVFRSSNLMINVLRERTVPRDVRALSPHTHDDFEQGSLTLSGVHIHHLRWPWTPDMTTWRDDQALQVGSPSVTVIPPHVVHTTRNVGDGPALLIDVFAPPRFDFSKRPGMVRNADEYPMPPASDPA